KDVSTHNGEVDIDVLYTGTSSKQRNDLETVFDIIRELKKEKNSAEIDEVISLSQARGLSVDRAEEAISNLKRTGQIYEPSYKKLDVIR
ncbi:MAG: minichromosome maintenance protein MCM, partial [Thermoplasmataceae archaeon]